jgi:ATP-dependent protease ClpP protease subunit
MRILASIVAALFAFTGCVSSAHAGTGPMCLKLPSAHVLGAVDEESVAEAIKYLDAAKERGDKSVVLKISSPGGSVFDGFELAQHIEDLGIPVHCHVQGMAASMGFFILQSCTTRSMDRRAILMAHEPSVGGLISGNETRFRNIAERLKSITTALVEQTCKRLRLTPAQFRAKIDSGREWWFNVDEAVLVGAVDRAY